MSAPVDVLAVMDDAAVTLAKVAQIQMTERAEEMRDARAAVAELIAAANAVPRCSYCESDSEWNRLSAALARIGGAP